MVVINCAYTEEINPLGASPVLTREQIWKGLQRKIRRAQDFVPMITSTDIVEEYENTVVREAEFEAYMGLPKRRVQERCVSHHPVKVDFWQPSGALIQNTVSEGPGPKENDYFMTYSFEWRYPEVEEGSDEHHQKAKECMHAATMAVHQSILAMRRMSEAGELGHE